MIQILRANYIAWKPTETASYPMRREPFTFSPIINAEVLKESAELCQSDVCRPTYADVAPMYEVAVMFLDLGCLVRESPLFYFFPVPSGHLLFPLAGQLREG